MSANNTVTVAVEIPAKIDPVNFVKNVKVQAIDIRKCLTDPSLNIRYKAGTEVFGAKVERDSLDIVGMSLAIKDAKGIQEPILVSLQQDGSFKIIRGNRRTYGAHAVLEDPTTDQETVKNLTTNTPAIVLKNLTPEQERLLVNDQTQKGYLRSEIVRWVFECRGMRWTFDQIANVGWEKIGMCFSDRKKVAEFSQLTDPMIRSAKLKTWLRGTLDCYLIWGYDLGSFVRKCIILSEMMVDGLVPETSEKPYFKSTKNAQKRIAELKKARELDGSKWSGVTLVDGSKFKEVCDKFHQEDYGTVTVVPGTPPTEKMMTKRELEGVKDSFQSPVARMLVARILGKEQPELTTEDDKAAILAIKAQAALAMVDSLRLEVATIVRLAFLSTDTTDWMTFLEGNVTTSAE